MKALRDQIGRLHIIAMSAAVALTIGLIAVTSVTGSHLTSAMRGEDARLQAISERAERIQMFARHIRKVSLTRPEVDLDIQFGGFVGPASQLEPGARLKLVRGDSNDHVLEVVSVNKVPQSFGVASAEARADELYIVSGRALWAAGEPVVRFLVTAAPEKPASTNVVEQQTL